MAETEDISKHQQAPLLEGQIVINWRSDGKVSVDGPTNPIMALKMLGDAMNILAYNYTQMVLKSQSPIIQPKGTVVDKKLFDAVKAQKKEGG
jgi:hypothetical protein